MVTMDKIGRTFGWALTSAGMFALTLVLVDHTIGAWAGSIFPPTQGIGVMAIYMIFIPPIVGIAFFLGSGIATVIFGIPFKNP